MTDTDVHPKRPCDWHRLFDSNCSDCRAIVQSRISDVESVPVDVIKEPPHYKQGIECWDYIVSHKMDFLQGNVVKYITRFKYKNGLEDLLKAKQYLEKLIKEVSGEIRS